MSTETHDAETQDREERSRETQKLLVKAALDRGEAITSLDALNWWGCFRLGARIWELKREGYPIEKQMVRVYSGKRVAQYWKGAA